MFTTSRWRLPPDIINIMDSLSSCYNMLHEASRMEWSGQARAWHLGRFSDVWSLLADSRLAPLLVAANRDPRRFPEPLLISRAMNFVSSSQ
jgi:hypothetical protein